jgi:hypothetical protein
MAVAVADGATTISDVAVLADQAALFGPVASEATCWRLLDRLDSAGLGAVARARAMARELVWAQRAELSGEPFSPARAGGRELPGLVIDLDASIVVCHSEKEQAAATFKKTFGLHPMLAFCDNTGEFLAALLRRNSPASPTAAAGESTGAARTSEAAASATTTCTSPSTIIPGAARRERRAELRDLRAHLPRRPALHPHRPA